MLLKSGREEEASASAGVSVNVEPGYGLEPGACSLSSALAMAVPRGLMQSALKCWAANIGACIRLKTNWRRERDSEH